MTSYIFGELCSKTERIYLRMAFPFGGRSGRHSELLAVIGINSGDYVLILISQKGKYLNHNRDKNADKILYLVCCKVLFESRITECILSSTILLHWSTYNPTWSDPRSPAAGSSTSPMFSTQFLVIPWHCVLCMGTDIFRTQLFIGLLWYWGHNFSFSCIPLLSWGKLLLPSWNLRSQTIISSLMLRGNSKSTHSFSGHPWILLQQAFCSILK